MSKTEVIIFLSDEVEELLSALPDQIDAIVNELPRGVALAVILPRVVQAIDDAEDARGSSADQPTINQPIGADHDPQS
jgi:hypothetical protein